LETMGKNYFISKKNFSQYFDFCGECQNILFDPGPML
jgi:hypothetical protein